MQPWYGIRPAPFGAKDIECLEDLLIYKRGTNLPVSLTLEAKTVYDMWRMSKSGHLKCFEYYNEFDDLGRPIVNREDIETLLWMDDLDSKGENRLQKIEAQKRSK
jgi:hypothetical protein